MMNRSKILCTILVGGLVCAYATLSAHGADFVVAPNGNDRNPGTAAKPKEYGGQGLVDETGYDLWLRYRPLADPAYRATAQGAISAVVPAGDSETIAIASGELSQGLGGLLNQTVPVEATKKGSGAVLIGTRANSQVIASQIPARDLADLGDEGYLIRAVTIEPDPCFIITANTDIGVLYGSYAFLRQIQAGTPLAELSHSSKPRNGLRLLNHWDNLNGSVERGYAGRSLWKWAQLPGTIDPRYADYARANASIGINGTVLNNVNANPAILTTSYLRKVAAIADVFRPYGIRVYLSVNFAAPISIGKLPTADPNNSKVRQWWADKADEIYGLIPDFGGFLVKANSEGQPGPLDYRRSHAEGANCLATALQPHGGLLLWRAFVYGRSGDSFKDAYTEFMPLDGDFEANVMIQVKNGPYDFQPREPIHPLFGKMTQTDLALELQITQEYLGHSTHMVYLGPMWKEVFDFDTGVAPGATMASVVDGTVHNRPLSLVAGVANIGSATNWCGHHMAQANWYAFGRMAWDPGLSSEGILDEWIPMTFGLNDTLTATLKPMLMQSHQRYIDYTMPLGLYMLCEKGPHYDPTPAKRMGGHQANSKGLGYDRTASGSDAISLYSATVAAMFSDLETCPEAYLLWFHHVPWDHTLSSGKTLIQELFERYDSWDDTGQWYLDNWNSLRGRIDNRRFSEVKAKLTAQKAHAKVWRDECVKYFSNVSGIPYE